MALRVKPLLPSQKTWAMTWLSVVLRVMNSTLQMKNFFTGTAAEVTPIREYDDREIGSGTRAAQLLNKFKPHSLMRLRVKTRNMHTG